MSNFYLCDMCGAHHWVTEDGLFVCESVPFALHKRVMVDYGRANGRKAYDDPLDVCPEFRMEERDERD